VSDGVADEHIEAFLLVAAELLPGPTLAPDKLARQP
jgi:hypothetical protein